MFVRLSGLSFSYTDSVSILAGVTLTLATGWTEVAGANGAGHWVQQERPKGINEILIEFLKGL